MNKSTLTFLGRDSGFGNKNNSAYFETNDKLTLIDCGCTVFHEAVKRFDFSKYFTINCDELYIDVSKFGGAHIKIDDVLDTLKQLYNNNVDIYLMHIDDKEYIKTITNNGFNYE